MTAPERVPSKTARPMQPRAAVTGYLTQTVELG